MWKKGNYPCRYFIIEGEKQTSEIGVSDGAEEINEYYFKFKVIENIKRVMAGN